MSNFNSVGMVVAPPDLQTSVDRFAQALQMSHKLLALHPRRQGGSGNAAALSPAIVQGSIAAFEGFAEDFTALMMAHNGSSFAEIAKKVGNWNNPTLADFAKHMKSAFPAAAPAIEAGDSIRIFLNPYRVSTWVERDRGWSDVLRDSEAWMQVRHLLAHGLATGWRSEYWPGPLRVQDPPAASVLRDMGANKHSLVVHGAITCARIYSVGARVIADATADAHGHKLDWSSLPVFV